MSNELWNARWSDVIVNAIEATGGRVTEMERAHPGSERRTHALAGRAARRNRGWWRLVQDEGECESAVDDPRHYCGRSRADD